MTITLSTSRAVGQTGHVNDHNVLAALNNGFIYNDGAGTFWIPGTSVSDSTAGHLMWASARAAAGGVASLDGSTKLPAAQLPTAALRNDQSNIIAAITGLEFAAYSSSGLPAANLYLAGSRGTSAVPAPIQSGDGYATVFFRGQYDATVGDHYSGVAIGAVATELFAGSSGGGTTNGGSQLQIKVTANGGATRVLAVTVDQDLTLIAAGAVTVGTTLAVTGAVTFSSSLALGGALTGVGSITMGGTIAGATNIIDLANSPTNTIGVASASIIGARQYAAGVTFRIERADGNAGAGTPVQSGEILGRYSFGGSTTTAANPTIYSGASINATTTEIWSGTAGGTKLEMKITPNTTQASVVAVLIDQDSSVYFGTTAAAAKAYVTSSTGAILCRSATGGIGYSTGAGGTSAQITSKATAPPALNAPCGQITMNNAALLAATIVTFTMPNSVVAATDTIVCNHISGGTLGAYTINARAGAGSISVDVRNNTAGSLSEALVLEFAVYKSVNA